MLTIALLQNEKLSTVLKRKLSIKTTAETTREHWIQRVSLAAETNAA